MVLARLSALICMALASSTTLKASNKRGMARLVKANGTQRLSSFISVAVTMTTTNSMLFYSQSSAH
jgi:hypothetical protein